MNLSFAALCIMAGIVSVMVTWLGFDWFLGNRGLHPILCLAVLAVTGILVLDAAPDSETE